MIRYKIPALWIHYDRGAILEELAEAKGAIMALKAIPFQRRWVEALQAMQLKLEIAGTTKIEGADFSGSELDVATQETTAQLLTRAQRQAHAAMQAYKWIAAIPDAMPFSQEIIRETHRLIVTGADDDHCAPGKIRERDHNVTFGSPPHRGCEGGDECAEAFRKLVEAVQGGFRQHDPLVQALALHYHFAAMHPFEDGNGRTARALEALFLQRAGMRDSSFIAMSNFYYEEKKTYLAMLSEVRQQEHDLTPFLKFALRGVALQSQRLANEIRRHVSIEVFRSLMFDLFHRLQSKRKRVIAERQIAILEHILTFTEIEWGALYKDLIKLYGNVQFRDKALIRDMNQLVSLGAIAYTTTVSDNGQPPRMMFSARLQWPTEITETEFFRKLSDLPRAKGQVFVPR